MKNLGLYPLIFWLFLSCAQPQTQPDPQPTDSNSLATQVYPLPPQTVLASLEPGGAKPEPAYAAIPDLFKKAQAFDQLIQGKLSTGEVEEQKKLCQEKTAENPFCQSFLKLEQLEKRLRKKFREKPQILTRPGRGQPVVLEFKDGKFVNWPTVRKIRIRSLLRPLAGFPLETLKEMMTPVLAEEKCPNNMAVALAATLEDHLPDQMNASEIASLYEKGARCVRHSPGDYEHFLTRAGLLHLTKKDTKAAVEFFSRASKTNTYASRAYYWLYRSHKELGNVQAANEALAQLKEKYPLSFHRLIAGIESNEDPSVTWMNAPVKINFLRRSKRQQSLNAFIEQAEILTQYGFDVSATFVADWALSMGQGAEYEVRLYLAALSEGKTRVSYASDIISQRPQQIDKVVLQLYFPKLYFPIFEKKAGALDPFILLAVARQESIFDPRAVSPANAQGLMQIHPTTGAILAGGTLPDLFNPEENITLGARYISELLRRMSGQIHLVLAAYNAGEEKLADWVRRYPADNPLLFVDLISYRETRNYVASVLRNYYWYRCLHHPQGAELVKNLLVPDVAKK